MHGKTFGNELRIPSTGKASGCLIQPLKVVGTRYLSNLGMEGS